MTFCRDSSRGASFLVALTLKQPLIMAFSRSVSNTLTRHAKYRGTRTVRTPLSTIYDFSIKLRATLFVISGVLSLACQSGFKALSLKGLMDFRHGSVVPRFLSSTNVPRYLT